MNLPGIAAANALQLLKNLPAAYVGDAAAVAVVVKATPLANRKMILANIAGGLQHRSITDQALAGRLLSGMTAKQPEVSSTFLELLSSVIKPTGARTSITSALEAIASRMKNITSFETAEQEWFQDPKVAAVEKADLLRIRRRMDKNAESHLVALIPMSQRAEVQAAQKVHSFQGVFESLAQKNAGTKEFLAQAKPESFELDFAVIGALKKRLPGKLLQGFLVIHAGGGFC